MVVTFKPRPLLGGPRTSIIMSLRITCYS